jgi:hypothetical protein
MNRHLNGIAVPGLRWTVAVVVLWESLQFALSRSAMHHFAQIGLPQWIRPALGGAEIIAVLLFLVPAARSVGGYLLLSIFAIAGVLHFLHGELNVGGLVVYGMAVIVCMTHPNREAVEASHDR